MRVPVLRSLICIALISLGSGTPAPAVSAAGTAIDPSRIVVFGDVHGGMKELQRLLRALLIIDEQDNWIGGNSRLVSLGDLLDRGADSRQVMDLLMKLETQALLSGGHLYLVLGNHEIMNLTGDLRYVAEGEFAAFAAEDPPQRAGGTAGYAPAAVPDHPAGYLGHRAAFLPTGKYGRWLLSKPQVLELEGTAFVHGGLSSHFANESFTEFNERAHQHLIDLIELGTGLVGDGLLQPDQDLLSAATTGPEVIVPADFLELRDALTFAEQGPTWYRGTASCHPTIETSLFESVLDARGIKRVIMGHTPTSPRIIQSRFAGRAILADTGMLESFYRGLPSAVIIDGETLQTLTLDSAGNLSERLARPAVDIRATEQAAFNTALKQTLAVTEWLNAAEPQPLQIKGRDYLGLFQRGSKRARYNRLAAGALDELLNLGLVAPVVRHQLNNKAGTVEVIPSRSLNEIERLADAIYRPNTCTDSSDYQLMYAFDALLGIDVRRGDTLHYDSGTWLMYLTGHDKAFPTTARLPRYLQATTVQLPMSLARQLARMDADGLEDALGSFLSDRQIKALLARRDLMLQTWSGKDSGHKEK